MVDDETVALLEEIRGHLRIIATVAMRPVLARFEQDVLRTEKRVKMFRAFNGQRTPNEVAEIAGVSGQAVRDLIKELRDAGFIATPSQGTQVASICYESILDWYHNRSAIVS